MKKLPLSKYDAIKVIGGGGVSLLLIHFEIAALIKVRSTVQVFRIIILCAGFVISDERLHEDSRVHLNCIIEMLRETFI